MKNRLILVALVVGYMALGLSLMYQQRAINTVIENQTQMLADYAALVADIQTLRRESNVLPDRVEKIEYQMDLVTAATRAGWGQAYRLLRAGAFEFPPTEQ